MHLYLFDRVKKVFNAPGRQNEVVAMPRGYGKTTIVTLVLPLHAIVHRLRRHILDISDSFDQAKEQLSTVKDELENNDRLIEDFGALKGPRWQESEIETTNGVKLVALGARMKIRGRKYRYHRPDLIILDDIENLVGVQSATRRETMQAWFFRSVMRAGWDDTKVFVVGTYLHHDCLLANLVDNPMFRSSVFKALSSWPTNMHLWDQWEEIITNLNLPDKEEAAEAFYQTHQEAMLQGAVSAWPEAFPVRDLMVMRVSEGEGSFATEMQNDPVDPSKALFRDIHTFRREYRPGSALVWLVPTDGGVAVPLNSCALFGFTDPAMGKTLSSDYAALVILAKAPTNQMFVLVADIRRRPPDVVMSEQNRYAQDYDITRWGIESNSFQALYASESARRSMEAAAYLPIVPITQLKNKALRLQSLQPDFKNKYILLEEAGQELLKQQLVEYPMGAHDDGPDALEGARTLAREWVPFRSTEVIQGEVHNYQETQGAFPTQPLSKDPYAQHDEAVRERVLEERARARDHLQGEELERALAALPVPVREGAIFVPQIVRF